MSSITYDWFTADDNGRRGGDGTVSIGNIPYYGGRVDRTANVVLTTTGGAQAVISVLQTAFEEYIEILQFETSEGAEINILPKEGGLFYLVGYSNSRYLTASETSVDANTDMNNSDGILKQGGFLLYENSGLGEKHSGVAINANITPDYGASDIYMFKMPFYLKENTDSSEIMLSFGVANQADTVSDSGSIYQDYDSSQGSLS